MNTKKQIFKLFILLLNLLNVSLFPIDDQAQAREKKSLRNQHAFTHPRPKSDCQTFIFNVQDYTKLDKDQTIIWDFGDRQMSKEPMVEHTYLQSGTYHVTLEVPSDSTDEKKKLIFTETLAVHVSPKANFEDPPNSCINQPIEFVAVPENESLADQLNFQWDFGDNNQKTGKGVNHTYRQEGNYIVKLLVDDRQGKNECSIDLLEKPIHLNAPPVANAGGDITLRCLSDPYFLALTFDASNSYDLNDADQLRFHWNFGDGTTKEGMVVQHTYKKTGKYPVTLTVKDNSGLACDTSQNTIWVNLSLAPKAEVGEDKSVCAGDKVEFDGTSSFVDEGENLLSEWVFGDGEKQRGLKVTHIYTHPDTYKATLTVENVSTLDCPPSSDTIKVKVNSPPQAKFKVASVGKVNEKIRFDASDSYDKDSDPLSFYWSFGDGTVLKGKNRVTHTYQKSGTYQVTLLVDDHKSSSCSSVATNSTIRIEQ